MTRSFYKFGIGIIGLLMVVIIWFAIQYFQQGETVFEEPWYLYVFGLSTLLELPAILVEFKYYKHKEYTLAWRVSILALIRLVVVSVAVYTALTGRAYGALDNIIYGAAILIGLLEGMVLVFSNAKERIHLRRLGFILLIFIPFVFTCHVLQVTSASKEVLAFTREAFRWIEVFGCMLPIFYVLNYLDELKGLPEETPAMG